MGTIYIRTTFPGEWHGGTLSPSAEGDNQECDPLYVANALKQIL